MTLNMVVAANDHLTLLAVSELENGTLVGGKADLLLEIREGSGRVFIDTYPLSKFDTQLSIRFAKDTACKFAQQDCSNYDFLYTIRASSNIIGGPSAGAAIAVITYAQLTNLDLNDTVSITGTINSGRMVGNVGGIKQKVEGALRFGLKKVLVPEAELSQKLEDNTTLDMVEYGKELGIEVVGVSDLEEALYHFTGQWLKKENVEFIVDDNYSVIMRNISEGLCSRATDLLELIEDSSLVIDNTTYYNEPINKTFNDGVNLITEAGPVFDVGSYYASASRCYGANNKLNFAYLLLQNLSDDYYKERIFVLDTAITLFQENVSAKSYSTIPSLQTIMVVRQRLDEAEGYLKIAKEYYTKDESGKNESKNTTTDTMRKEGMIYYLALGIERLHSAKLWFSFFGMHGQEYNLDKDSLKQSCETLVRDAKSRIQYARIYVPNSFSEKSDDLNGLENEDPAYCIAKASLIKADLNALLSSIGLETDDVSYIVTKKLDKVSEILMEETVNGRFPILGYSYYEYAKTLTKTDPVSALIYSEYALELSNLDLYFPPQTKEVFTLNYPSKFKKLTELSIIKLSLFILCSILVAFILGIKFNQFYFKSYFNVKRKKLSKKKRK